MMQIVIGATLYMLTSGASTFELVLRSWCLDAMRELPSRRNFRVEGATGGTNGVHVMEKYPFMAELTKKMNLLLMITKMY